MYVFLRETPSVGRPSIQINIEEVEFLRALHLPWIRIAEILDISRHTLYRWLKNEGILQELQFTEISDNDLDEVMKGIKEEHPNDGEVLVSGHLLAKGIRVPRSRMRASIHRVDPINTAQWRSKAIVRRRYTIGEPNEVWHCDGHHKLIRWRLVTHGCIDGYSRVITYLHCSTNNAASTVLSSFAGAVARYGLPQRVRSDLGGENVDVWRYMIAQHGDERVVITGSSPHNQRIERLWWDVFRCVGILFYDVLYALEQEEVLDPLNETDIFCAHCVFLPRINRCLQQFAECWNNHRLSSEHNQTHYQLFVTGSIGRPSDSSRDHSVVQIPSHIRVLDAVSVPRSTFQPCQILQVMMEQFIDPFNPSSDLGVSAYKQCVALVGTHMTLCSVCTCEETTVQS